LSKNIIDGVQQCSTMLLNSVLTSISQPLGRGSVPGPGINYTEPREILLEFVILVF